jgi:hypothetical protein
MVMTFRERGEEGGVGNFLAPPNCKAVFLSSTLAAWPNAQFCCQRYGVSLSDLHSIDVNFIKHCFFSKIDTDLMSRVILLLELLFIRDESFFLPGLGLDPAEVSAIISHLCRD